MFPAFDFGFLKTDFYSFTNRKHRSHELINLGIMDQGNVIWFNQNKMLDPKIYF